MRLYIAGRMANEPDYQAKFKRACAEVAALGHFPISPCDIHETCTHGCWADLMICDLHTLLDCEGVYALRDWHTSKGATIEVQLAMRLGKEIVYQ